jgi:RNA polymerase sigma-70 factor (ECF subfamily)
MNSTINQVQHRAATSARYAEWSDEELLLKYCQAGERRAFEELVHRYERELFGYLRHYLGDAEMAEDAFQATFLQVHLKCEQFEQGRKVRPWLYTVATNQAIDAQRRNRRHRMVSLSRRAQGNGQDEESGSLEDVLGSQESGPLAQAEASELQDRVRRSVDQLPEPLREVLLLVYYQGLKYREAAQVLGIPVGTVKSRLHAAVGKLNQAITPSELLGNG